VGADVDVVDAGIDDVVTRITCDLCVMFNLICALLGAGSPSDSSVEPLELLLPLLELLLLLLGLSEASVASS